MSEVDKKSKSMGDKRKRSSSRQKGGKPSPSPRETDKNTVKYARKESINFKVSQKIKHKNLKMTLAETHDRIIDAASRTATTEVLLDGEKGYLEAEHEGEKTFSLKQAHIMDMVDANTAKNIMDLKLPDFGPYCSACSRNGRSLLLAGEKGHVAIMDCQKIELKMETQLHDKVYDVHYLHNEALWASAQGKYTYIYDDAGVEIHCLKGFERTYKLDFLPYHFLLTAVGHSGWIKWQDVSVGKYVAGFQTGHGPTRVLKHNPGNAISHVGHGNGVVSLWSPASGKALVSMFCHKAPVLDLAVDRGGSYMATSGADSLVKIWDLRTYKCLHSFRADKPAVSLDISDTGLLAMGMGRQVHILKDCFARPAGSTYMKHSLQVQSTKISGGGSATAQAKGLLSSMRLKSVVFRPFEDALFLGHSHGVSSIVVPGAGEANFDSLEVNPFINKKQAKESEVQALMNKLDYQMINLDANFIGSIDKDQNALREEHRALFSTEDKKDTKGKDKKKARGRNKISAKLRRKQKNVVDANSVKLREKLAKEKEARQPAIKEKETDGALKRFK